MHKCNQKVRVLQIQAYKEDFEQERKDRENAHHIKEEEIMKMHIKMEELVADHQMELKRMQDYYKDQKVRKLTTMNISLDSSTYIFITNMYIINYRFCLNP